MFSIKTLPAFKDNYIYLFCSEEDKKAAVIDPGDSSIVLSFLRKEKYNLSDILVTHHHLDHIGGIIDLKKETGACVYGPNNKYIEGLDIFLSNQTIKILNEQIIVFRTPGHTLDHICYYLPKRNILFSGDTLFSFGCGRLFEGSAAQMWKSLKTLRKLPKKTKVYSAHEYTLKNLLFACSLEPKNKALHDIYTQFSKKQLPLVPTTLFQEKRFNPFFKCDDKFFIKSIEKYRGKDFSANKTLNVFSYIRKLKNDF